MSQLHVLLKTGGDDLRPNSYATLRVFLSIPLPGGVPLNYMRIFDAFTGKAGLAGGSEYQTTVDLGEGIEAIHVNSFQVQHVSVDGLFQTRDNWNMDRIEFRMPVYIPSLNYRGPEHTVAIRKELWRFTGSTAILDIPIGTGVV